MEDHGFAGCWLPRYLLGQCRFVHLGIFFLPFCLILGLSNLEPTPMNFSRAKSLLHEPARIVPNVFSDDVHGSSDTHGSD
ncbi:hypothetical protein FNV43_RR04570 [Rhamnella rubrinervis]|uniref:Uncharacterized protein n=1 Tax=Rhamnella rubrinervis TaxID=2594499 RepID=A0A8K0HM72_9ROSA|nr:hypothetical protein FNV43_RR04570 [Rhamnella rubrinervis]